MLTTNAEVKIIDFGLSMRKEENEEIVQMVGSPHYLSPEMLRMSPHSFPTDIWSVGIVLLELVNREDYTLKDPLPFLYDIARKGILSPNLFPPQTRPEMVAFITLCLQTDPDSRPTARLLCRDSFLSLRCSADLFHKQVTRCFVGKVLEDIGLGF
jgi:serine/threonine protein kinase